MEANKFYDLVRYRRSIRAYDPEKAVPREVLNRILDAGRLAPTASNRQPAKFHLISGREVLERIRPCYSRSWFHEAPSLLVISGKREDAWVRSYDGYNSLEIDIAIMMDHMILAAESEGVSTCWIIAFDPAVVTEALQLDPDDIPYVMTPLGYPPEGYTKREMPERKSLEELVIWY